MNDFEQLLQMAATQPEPQRLLFVFLKTELPEEADHGEIRRFQAGQGGALVPMMYVGKSPAELTTFEALARESQQMAEDWQLVLVGALSGSGGQPPTDEQADSAARGMMGKIRAGADLSGFMAFDRDGDSVRFASPAYYPA